MISNYSFSQKEHFDYLYKHPENFRWFYYFTMRGIANFIYNNILKNKLYCKRILDIGCGIGMLEFFLDKLISNCSSIEEVIGIDISETGIKRAGELVVNPKFKFIEMDYRNINLLGKFDIVIATEFIEHISDAEDFIHMVCKSLNNNGYFVLTTPNRERLQNRIFKLIGKEPVLCDVSHVKEYTFLELKEYLEKHGFEIVKYDARGLWGGWIAWYLFRFLPNKWKEKIAFSPFFRGENRISYYLGKVFKNIANFIYIIARKE